MMEAARNQADPAQEPTVRPAFNGPLFIVGMPRSGTKLLRSIVNRHSRVSIPNAESEFLPFWVDRWTSFGDLSDRDTFARFCRDCQSLPFFKYANLDGKGVDEQAWYANCREFTPQGVFRALILTCQGLTEEDRSVWGDKSPSYLTCVSTLKRLYPEARFVHIIRDVRDYCLSINKAWGKNMLRAAQRWSDDITVGRHEMAAFRDDCLEIHYEELLGNPERTVGRVCEFVGIDYRKDMLDVQDGVEKIGDASGSTGILRTNLRKFETALDTATRSKIESIGGHTLRELGYDCPSIGAPLRLGPARMRWLQALDGINLLRAEARHWGILGSIPFVFRYYSISGNRHR